MDRDGDSVDDEPIGFEIATRCRASVAREINDRSALHAREVTVVVENTFVAQRDTPGADGSQLPLGDESIEVAIHSRQANSRECFPHFPKDVMRCRVMVGVPHGAVDRVSLCGGPDPHGSRSAANDSRTGPSSAVACL